MIDGSTLLEGVENLATAEALLKANSLISGHRKTVVSISGGSDSDVVLDICEKVKGDSDVEYVWFNTGLEYQATKDHLKYLEEKYGIEIKREKPIKPIPTCVREYGVPFLSKFVSDFIYVLQKHGFKWEDKPLEELIEEYPNCPKSALKWWCNTSPENSEGVKQYKISYNKWLKEFMIANPPDFQIANKCCIYSKKRPAKKFLKNSKADLNVIGVRQAEGGIRATSYKNCYTRKMGEMDNYRPLFWFTDEDKKYYEKHFGVKHSACYTKYGFKRTGCVGCPYNRQIFDDLKAVEKYEPKLYKACMKVFGKSYEYTKKYRQFCAEMNYREKVNPDQLTLFDMFYDFSG